ncbi:MAG: DUF2127 domain-containing protein [Acidobacteriota bacterium]|nr:DUF2127 domain-containing protein [Acidobacteriota bacterium]
MKISRKTVLHDAFRAGIVLKGIDGVVETLGGAMVWLLTPDSAARIVRALFRHELAEDPKDFLVNHLLWTSRHLAASRWFAAAFLLTHGIAKIGLVMALWFNRLWAYPLMIAVLGGFAVYQTARFAETHSVMLGLLTLFDLAIIGLTWREYREQRALRAGQGGTPSV